MKETVISSTLSAILAIILLTITKDPFISILITFAIIALYYMVSKKLKKTN